MPLSMMVVHSSTWNFFSTKSGITFSSWPSPICPCATPMVTLGHQLLEELLHRVDGLHAVVDEEDLPAALHLAHDGLLDRPAGRTSMTKVRMARRSCGGVAMMLMSRSPDMRHVQRARDGRRRQGEHVHLGRAAA